MKVSSSSPLHVALMLALAAPMGHAADMPAPYGQPGYDYAAAQGYYDPYAQGYADPYAQAYPDPYAQAYPDPNAQAYSDPYAQGYADPYPQSYADPYAQGYSDPYAQGYYPYADPSAPQAGGYADPYGYNYPAYPGSGYAAPAAPYQQGGNDWGGMPFSGGNMPFSSGNMPFSGGNNPFLGDDNPVFGGDNPMQDPFDNHGYWADKNFRPWQSGPFERDDWTDNHPMSNMPWGNFPGWGDGFFGGFGPDSWKGATPWGNDVPFRWINPTNPRDMVGDIWDDALNTPSKMGRMPPGWTAPYISVPNPVEVEEEFERNARKFPDEMQNMINTGDGNFGNSAGDDKDGDSKDNGKDAENGEGGRRKPKPFIEPVKPVGPIYGDDRKPSQADRNSSNRNEKSPPRVMNPAFGNQQPPQRPPQRMPVPQAGNQGRNPPSAWGQYPQAVGPNPPLRN